MTTLREMIDKLPEERRRRVEERASILIAEEMSLRRLQCVAKLTSSDTLELDAAEKDNLVQ